MEGKKIAIITPMKDEITNLPKLIDSINSQEIKIFLWVIIDDKSSDGSNEYLLRNRDKIKNVEHFHLVRSEHLDDAYNLGKKYAAVVSYGFKELERIIDEINEEPDYIGILDADCFLDKKYYSNLLKKFKTFPKLGIASGKLFYFENGDKIFHRYPDRWAIGGVRLWRTECYKESGYITGYSADALSTAKARMRGWQVQSFEDSLVKSRPVGKNVNSEYYGKSAYYRYIPFYFVLFRVFFYTLINKRKQVEGYLNGYLNAKKEKMTRLSDPELKRYFKTILYRTISENMVVIRNKFLLKLKNS
ncbi:glycosyltransferase family 2 protein [Anaerophaga thermohalophila]|uniref:glycosyltransferase family 2 protein n=1 Tax=Anaerophaga thermohalophila TaxID=177400 RepID=UPI0002E58D87|nr:glycosyltransferase family 2 protein [Anaerophaga thermohalophila]